MHLHRTTCFCLTKGPLCQQRKVNVLSWDDLHGEGDLVLLGSVKGDPPSLLTPREPEWLRGQGQKQEASNSDMKTGSWGEGGLDEGWQEAWA